MLAITKENISTEVYDSELPVLVDFWGPSCQPCLALMPSVEQLSNQYTSQIKFAKVNSAENRRLCIDLRVIGLPSFLIFKQGKEVARISGGAITREDIENMILQNIQ